MGAARKDDDVMSNLCIRDHSGVIVFQSIACLAEIGGSDRIYLEPNAIHLWGITLDGSAPCLAQCRGWLDERERDRAAQRIRAEDGEQFIFAHGGLRAVLSQYLGVGPDEVEFDHGESGKPMLAKDLRDPSGITFNMSHAHGRALIAVSRAQEVGVDLERVRSEIPVKNLSRRFFTQSEHTAIMQLPPEQRATRFFRYWVAKEALLKAQGIGLRGLSDCEIFLEVDGVDKEAQARLGSQFTNPLLVRLLPCEQGWEAAVAAPRLDSIQRCGLE
jgi:4'-phosphopantetheinyl transferase